ncbi:MAG: GFA family protein [Enterobacterales bacterium]|nr:GFA family protein [Enterobacterales bacterium]
MIYQASCHCGAVKFEFEAPEKLEVDECNCSICRKAGILHLILPKKHFKLLSGETDLTNYQFGTKIAKHTFCKHCGIEAFYTPRSNPDGISVNARCLDTKPKAMKIVPFDGQNWEDNAHKLAHKSVDI